VVSPDRLVITKPSSTATATFSSSYSRSGPVPTVELQGELLLVNPNPAKTYLRQVIMWETTIMINLSNFAQEGLLKTLPAADSLEMITGWMAEQRTFCHKHGGGRARNFVILVIFITYLFLFHNFIVSVL
jgi:hypothetical protein